MEESDEEKVDTSKDESLRLSVANIANKLANILYITNISMKENCELSNNLHYAKFMNDMKSYCANLIQAINNMNNTFYNVVCLPIYKIPVNPYTNNVDANTITSNISTELGIDEQKERQGLLMEFQENYKDMDFEETLKNIGTFNDEIQYALNNIGQIQLPTKYKEKKIYGAVVSDRLKERVKDFKHLEHYIATVKFGLF